MNVGPGVGRRWLGWAGIAFVGLLVAATSGAEPRGYWAPRGFVERADDLIRNGGLTLRCGVQDSIFPTFDPGSVEERFFRSSYLRSDVRRFNQDPTAPRSPFIVDGCDLRGVDPFFHRIDLPYNRIPRWTGGLRFGRADRSATLLGGPNQELFIYHPGEGSGVRESARVDPRRSDFAASAEFVRVETPGAGEIAADFFFVGHDPVMADRRDVGAITRLRLDGFHLPPGRQVRLSTGDWIQFARGDELVTYQVRGADQAEVISAAGRDGHGRTYQVAGIKPFASLLSQAMDAALQSVPSAQDGGYGADLDVRLTLDRELELATGEILDRWCGNRRLPDRPRAVSALVMDAFSGAVRAMPTCPGEADLEAFPQLPSRIRSRLLRNQNLIAHPVGSAAKPFWAAAVGTSQPWLLDLEIPGHDDAETTEVFGCPLPAPYATATHGDWEGFESFIQSSCNRYLIELATASLLATDAGSGCAEGGRSCLPAPTGEEEANGRICDRLVRLTLSEALPFTGSTCGDLRLIDADFGAATSLEAVGGIAAYRDRAPLDVLESGIDPAYRAGRYRLDVWRDPLEALKAAGDTADGTRSALRFAAVAPEVTNLALNTVEDLRADWVNLLLGGENSRWSNFQLAEATARLLTGRAVRGSLVEEVGDLDPGESGPWLTREVEPAAALPRDLLHSGARRRVLHAMELVTAPGGTGARLAPAIAGLERRLSDVVADDDYEVRVFAKTGTPTVSPEGPGRQAREGSVLILGVLVVPPEAGAARSMREREWVSACPLDSGLSDGILSVPPVDLLDPSEALGLTLAVFLDDQDADGSDLPAAALGGELLEPLGDYLAEALRIRLRNGPGTASR